MKLDVVIPHIWIAVELLREPRDLWVGVYRHQSTRTEKKTYHRLYLCLLPCFPLKIDVQVG